jgi:hypothetical protein
MPSPRRRRRLSRASGEPNRRLAIADVAGPDGKKIIATDPEVAPIVSKLFQWYATGQYALKEMAEKARDAGCIYRRTGTRVPISAVQAETSRNGVESKFVCEDHKNKRFVVHATSPLLGPTRWLPPNRLFTLWFAQRRLYLAGAQRSS